MFCSIYRKRCRKNVLRNGTLKIGFSTLTLLLLALSVQEFLVRNHMTVVPHPL
jgi:hypothetical protein